MLPLWVPKTESVAVANTAAAYAAGDVLGGLLTIPCRNPQSDQARGFAESVQVVDFNAIGAALKLYLFGEQPASVADNAAFEAGLADADWGKLIAAPIDIATYVTYNTNKAKVAEVVFANVINREVMFNTASGNLYAYLVTAATPTFTAANKVQARFRLWLM